MRLRFDLLVFRSTFRALNFRYLQASATILPVLTRLESHKPSRTPCVALEPCARHRVEQHRRRLTAPRAYPALQAEIGR